MPNRASDLVWDDPDDARSGAGADDARAGASTTHPGADTARPGTDADDARPRTGAGNARPDARGGRTPDARGSGGLTRSRLVETALALADSDGLDAVSIRRVADRLGTRPMSLYTHIASKDDLISLMLNEVSGELLVPGPLPEDWREALTQIARRSHEAYLAHPWMLSAFGRGPRVGPNLLRRAEQSASAVAGLPIEPADAWTALRIVHEWTMGHALHAITLREDGQLEAQLREADPAQFPQMSRVFPSGRGQPHDAAFETALAVVLDGIEARFLRK